HAGDVLPTALLVLALLAATIFALVRRPALGFAGAFFFGVLAPTSLTPGTIQMIVEHRMYLSLAAVLGLLALAAEKILGRGARWILVAVGAANALLTIARNRDYRDEVRLLSTAAAARPHSAIAWANLGLAEFRAGHLERAIAADQRALRENPRSAEAHYNLGLALARADRLDEAIAQDEAALQLQPGFA